MVKLDFILLFCLETDFYEIPSMRRGLGEKTEWEEEKEGGGENAEAPRSWRKEKK